MNCLKIDADFSQNHFLLQLYIFIYKVFKLIYGSNVLKLVNFKACCNSLM